MTALTLREFLKRHMLWVALLAVVTPLSVLLGLQYGWLVSLQKTSAIAEKASLNTYLNAVSREISYFYEKQAYWSLNVPEEAFRNPGLGKIESHFRKQELKGVRYLFGVRYTEDNWDGDLVIYDPVKQRVVEDPGVLVNRAIHVALAPWKTLAHSGASLHSHEMSVDTRDPQNRIILKPIAEDRCRVLGVTGMIVDNDFFKETLLPVAIRESLPSFVGTHAKENLSLTVLDGRGRLAYGEDVREKPVQEVTQRLPFVFSDWRIVLASRFDTPEQLARSNFVLNVSLSVLLALVVLMGIVLALRTASREIKLSQMKSDFVSNVSHELRTPLASIRVFGEFLRLGRVRDDDKAAEYGEYIETESRRLTQLINNILDFSKIESGAKSYEFETADLQEIVADTLKTMDVSVRHKGFRLDFKTPDVPLPAVELDTDAIAQAVANLVDNAIKYSDGANDVQVQVGRTAETVYVAVRDHGIGISRTEQKKIFERFHRVSTGLVHDVKGSGLGLSIVSHIVKAHGGRVTVDSEPGRGSTFMMHVPLRRPAGHTAVAEAKIASGRRSSAFRRFGGAGSPVGEPEPGQAGKI